MPPAGKGTIIFRARSGQAWAALAMPSARAMTPPLSRVFKGSLKCVVMLLLRGWLRPVRAAPAYALPFAPRAGRLVCSDVAELFQGLGQRHALAQAFPDGDFLLGQAFRLFQYFLDDGLRNHQGAVV